MFEEQGLGPLKVREGLKQCVTGRWEGVRRPEKEAERGLRDGV